MQINLEQHPNPLRIRIPGLQHEMGLGQAIANLTQAVGVKPCGGCHKRKEALDSKVQFVPRTGWEA